MSDVGKLNRVNLSMLNPEDNGGMIHHLNNANTLKPYGLDYPTKLIPTFIKKDVYKTQKIIDTIEEELHKQVRQS